MGSPAYVRRLAGFVLVLGLLAAVASAEENLQGTWIGISHDVGVAYRLELGNDGVGKLFYVSHTSGDPITRAYAVSEWQLKGERLSFELEPLGEAGPLRLSGKLAGRQLALGVVQRKGARPEPLRMSREELVLADYERMAAASK